MRRSAVLFSTGLMIAFSACSTEMHSTGGKSDVASTSAPSAPAASIQMSEDKLSSKGATIQAGEAQRALEQQVSLESAAAAQAAEHKVIKNAEITIETDTPEEGQKRIGVIAEKHGGFVITSESKQNEAVSQNVASTPGRYTVRNRDDSIDAVHPRAWMVCLQMDAQAIYLACKTGCGVRDQSNRIIVSG